jgi:hypothetical protein
MRTTDHDHLSTTHPWTGLSRPLKTALLMAALVGGFYLLREQGDSAAGSWVYLLLLACPLMHLFHGHGGHGRPDGPDRRGRPLDTHEE